MGKSFLTFILILLYFTSPSQTFQWVRNDGGQDGEFIHGLEISTGDYIYLTGEFMDTASFGDTTLIARGSGSYRFDSFLTKYDSLGNVIWVEHIGGNYMDGAHDVAVDTGENVYLGGSFSSTDCIFGKGINADTLAASHLSFDAFLCKYDSTGNLLWTLQGVGGANGSIHKIDILEDGSVVAVGHFEDSISFGSFKIYAIDDTSGHVFLLRTDPSGQVQLLKRIIQQTNVNTFDDVFCHAIDHDSSNFLYLTGIFNGPATFDTIMLSNTNTRDGFVAKYDMNGNVQWVRQITGSSDIRAKDLQTDSIGNSYVLSSFSGTAIISSTVFSSTYVFDAVIAKFDKNGNFLWGRQTQSSISAAGYELAISGNALYATGVFKGNCTFGMGNNSATISSTNQGASFFAKYDTDGNFIWAKGTTDSWLSRGQHIEVDGSNDNCYVAGYFSGTTDFGDNITLTSVPAKHIYLGKIKDDYHVGVTPNTNYAGELVIYPNPSTAQFTLHYSSSSNEPVTIKVWDSIGKCILISEQEKASEELTKEINLRDAGKGIYLLEIVQNNSRYTKRIIVN